MSLKSFCGMPAKALRYLRPGPRRAAKSARVRVLRHSGRVSLAECEALVREDREVAADVRIRRVPAEPSLAHAPAPRAVLRLMTEEEQVQMLLASVPGILHVLEETRSVYSRDREVLPAVDSEDDFLGLCAERGPGMFCPVSRGSFRMKPESGATLLGVGGESVSALCARAVAARAWVF